MKYLETYKLFESRDKDLSNNIEDILIDLKDDGCMVDVKYYPGYGNTAFIRGEEDFRYSYNVLITKPNKEFNIDEKINQLTSFMESEGYPQMRMDEIHRDIQPNPTTHIFLFFGKDNYNERLPNRSGYVRIKEAKKLDPETNFKGIIDDVLTDARDRGFQYRISSDKTTHIIYITYRSKTEIDRDRLEPKRTFKWGEIKDDVLMLVNYLSDTYPKISFNEFQASLKFRKESSIKRPYSSVRSILKSAERGIRSYNLKDFMGKLEDTDVLENLTIQCLVRFRGKINI